MGGSVPLSEHEQRQLEQIEQEMQRIREHARKHVPGSPLEREASKAADQVKEIADSPRRS